MAASGGVWGKAEGISDIRKILSVSETSLAAMAAAAAGMTSEKENGIGGAFSDGEMAAFSGRRRH